MNIETAKRLFEYRKANGFSQEELAEKRAEEKKALEERQYLNGSALKAAPIRIT